MYLRKSTASQQREIGQFVDDTDFKTPKTTGITIAASDIKLVINGGASVNKNSGGGTHRVNGVWVATFDATDTATVGELVASVFVSGALVAKKTFWVFEGAIYDAFFGASAAGFDASGRVDIGKIVGSTTAATFLKTNLDTMFIGSVTGSPTSSSFIDSTLTGAGADHWKGRYVIFTSGALAKQASDITAFNQSTKALTFTTMNGAPSTSDTYIII